MKHARIGIGYDSHRFVEGRPLVLGGVRFPSAKGLAGHSDADVLVHAVIDALLGAAAAGDIGGMFPDGDEAFRGVSSIKLLAKAVEAVRRLGYAVGNVDVVLIAEEPRIGPRADEIRCVLAPILGVDENALSVKGKSNESMGFVGRGEGIAAQAVALLIPL